jgi:hypothetical protein
VGYTQQTWNNGPNSGTPLNANRLNHMEAGIAAAATAADNANGGLVTKASSADVTAAVAAVRGELRAELFGGTSRTKPYRCVVTYNADFTTPAGADTFATAPGNWAAYSDPDGMYRTGTAQGGAANFARIIIPATGWWEIESHILGDIPNAGIQSCSIAARTDTAAPTINDAVAFDNYTATGSAQISMNPRIVGVLAAGTAIYWSTWGSNAWYLRGTKFNGKTQVIATWKGSAS